MKVITLYRCEFCDTQFSDENKAKECEKIHLKPKKVKPKKYYKGKEEPHTVIVEMTNGDKYIYESKGKYREK